MNRRQFLHGIGLFLILPGAGRLWKATTPTPPTLLALNLPPEYHRAFLNQFFWGVPIPHHITLQLHNKTFFIPS